MGVASQIADKLLVWAHDGGSRNAKDSRGISDLNSYAGEIDNMRLLVVLSDQLNELEEQGVEVSHFREAFPSWVKAYLAPDIVWGSKASGGIGRLLIEKSSIGLLKSLDQVYAAHAATIRPDFPSLTYSAQMSASIGEALEQLRGEFDDLGANHFLMEYTLRLSDELSEVFGAGEVVTDEALLNRIMTLVGYLSALADVIEARQPDKASKLRETISKLMPLGARAARAVERGTAFLADLDQITGGL